MNLADSLAPSPAGKSIRHLALGFFDGLHLGHQRVILGGAIPHPPAATAVLTFRDHPLSILHPEKHPDLITGFPHKIRVLERWGIGQTVALPFDEARSRQEPVSFLAELTAAFPHLRTVSVGPNWRFGKDRSGDVGLLSRWCDDKKILLDNPDPVMYAGARISSSRIREAIHHGNLPEASAMLGRPYTLLGRVIPGDGRGKQIGFPTANLQTEDECLPPDGVYAGQALLAEKKSWPAAMNLGTRPTFQGTDRRIEAHLIGYSGNLVNTEMDLEFHRWIRAEMKFSNPYQLSEQIRKDLTFVTKK